MKTYTKDLSEYKNLKKRKHEIFVRSISEDNKIVSLKSLTKTYDNSENIPIPEIKIEDKFIVFPKLKEVDFYYIYLNGEKINQEIFGKNVEINTVINLDQIDLGRAEERKIKITACRYFTDEDISESELSNEVIYTGKRWLPAPEITDIQDDGTLYYTINNDFDIKTVALYIDGRFFKKYDVDKTQETHKIDLSDIKNKGAYFITLISEASRDQKDKFLDSSQSNEIFYSTIGYGLLTSDTEESINPKLLTDRHKEILIANKE